MSSASPGGTGSITPALGSPASKQDATAAQGLEQQEAEPSLERTLSPGKAAGDDAPFFVPKEKTLLDDERPPDAGVATVLEALATQSGGGSVLRGWRLELDPDGLCQVRYQDLCCFFKRSKLLDGGQTAAQIYKSEFLNGQRSHIDLIHLAPRIGALVQRFREWVAGTFGGPQGMIVALSKLSEGSAVKAQEFCDGCREHGFESDDRGMGELWGLCNPDDREEISAEQVIFLELDPAVRDLDLFNLNVSRKNQRYDIMANLYKEERQKKRHPKHRLALRPWQTSGFEKLPKMVCEKNRARQHQGAKRQLEAKKLFLEHIRKKFGNPVRAWRRELDPNASFALTLTALRRLCAKSNCTVDIATLWRTLDIDHTDWCGLEMVCPSASILATFRHWCISTFGSCAAVWDHETMAFVRRYRRTDENWSVAASKKKMLFASLAEGLRQLGWPLVDDAHTKSALFAALDFFGCGFVSREDFEWLDKWNPPQWLYAEPDEEARADLQASIDARFGHPLSAWRSLLDKDDSNEISWAEFQDACKEVGFQGNIPGAYRSFDADGSGHISMMEYHTPSAELLTSFKNWAETTYGSVKLAFQSLDVDGGGTLTFQEVKRACTRNRWEGDVKLLFDCLDVDKVKNKSHKRSISASELAFLDSWVLPQEDADQERQSSHTSITPSIRGSRSLPSLQSAIGAPAVNAWVQRFTAPRSKGKMESPTQKPAPPAYWSDPMRETNFQKWKASSGGI